MKKHRNLMLKYGSMMGGVSIALTLLQHQLQAYNGAPLTIFAFGILPILFLTFFIFLGIHLSKERSFRQMIKIGLGISILFAIIAGVFWVIFIQYIDPNHLDRVNHLQLEAYRPTVHCSDATRYGAKQITLDTIQPISSLQYVFWLSYFPIGKFIFQNFQ